MKHLGTKQIETKNLILRRFTIDDAEAMYKNWASDDEVTKYLMWPTHTDVEVSKAVLKSWIENYDSGRLFIKKMEQNLLEVSLSFHQMVK